MQSWVGFVIFSLSICFRDVTIKRFRTKLDETGISLSGEDEKRKKNNNHSTDFELNLMLIQDQYQAMTRGQFVLLVKLLF